MYPTFFPSSTLSVVPQSITGAATCTAIDTYDSTNGIKYNAIIIDVIAGTMANAWSSLKLTESNDDSTYRDIDATVAAVTTVATGSTGDNRLPQTSDASKVVRRFIIKLDGTRQRYIKPAFNTGAGASLCCVVAYRHLGTEMPSSNSERGVQSTLIL